MTLVLAFFICLQSLSAGQSKAGFYAGQGSFIHALETFGLGGLFSWLGGSGEEDAPRYKATEGQDESPTMKRTDPDVEEAQRALETLEDQFEVTRPPAGEGWHVDLSTPFSYAPGKQGLTVEEEQFLKDLTPTLSRVLAARGFVIRIGAAFSAPQGEELERAKAALAAAQEVRTKLIENMDAERREVAAHRIYSCCRFASKEEARSEAASGKLKVELLLTKPYVDKFSEGSGNANASNKSSDGSEGAQDRPTP